MELPTRITGVPMTSDMNLSSMRVLACTVELARRPGVRPNPCRSRATTRRPAASAGPIRHQFRCEPPSPCTNTIGMPWAWSGSRSWSCPWSPAGENSIQCTGPSRSVTKLVASQGAAKSYGAGRVTARPVLAGPERGIGGPGRAAAGAAAGGTAGVARPGRRAGRRSATAWPGRRRSPGARSVPRRSGAGPTPAQCRPARRQCRPAASRPPSTERDRPTCCR